MESPSWAIEYLGETLASTVVVAGVAMAVAGLSFLVVSAAVKRIQCLRRHGGRTARAPEVLFVGRWGDRGPELFRVGKCVRRLDEPGQQDRGPRSSERDSAAVAFARRILTEVMWQRPPTPLARAFADAQLAPLPGDGFVLSASDVEAWLDNPHGGTEPSRADVSPRTW